MQTITFFLIILIIWVTLIFIFSRKRKISNEKKDYFRGELKKILDNWDFSIKIINLDKLYHKILLEMWYSWTFWEILKRKPKEINDLNKIWELHKLRNKLAHEFENIDKNILSKKVGEYKREVERLF